MKIIRVLQVNKLYYPAIGGIERVVQQIAEGLKDQVDMSVMVCQSKGRGCRDVVNDVPVQRCGSLGTLLSLPISFSLLWELRKQAKGKDILQFHAPFPLGDLACLLSGYKGKVALYWHSDVVKQKKFMFLYRPIMERFLKRADVIIVGAKGVLYGSEYLGPYKDKCVVVPFAVNSESEKRGRLYLENKSEDNSEECVLRFLFVGRLVYYKGVDVLLEAFSKVSGAELTIIGTGELEKSMKDFVEVRRIADKVHFLGQVDEDRLNEEFAKCDVFVLSSVVRSEAFGLVQLEAMAYGKPVINTNLPSGVPEVSLHGKTGLTVEPGDSDALLKAMQWMVEHPEERSGFGKAARERIDEYYTLDKVLGKVHHIYEQLIAEETE